MRSTIDFQLGGAASVGEYKKIISVSSNELIMQIANVKRFKADVHQSVWRKANARNVSFEILYGG